MAKKSAPHYAPETILPPPGRLQLLATTLSDPRRLKALALASLQRSYGRSFAVAALSVLLSLAALFLSALAADADPVQVLVSLVQGALSGRYAILTTFAELTAISLCGLAVQIPLRAGFFNVGGQGQLEAGALACVMVALKLQATPWLAIPAALAAAAVGGALAAVIPLFLRLRRGANEVTTTIMVNFACVNLSYALVTGPMKDPRAFYGTTPTVPEAVRLPVWLGGVGSGVWITVAIAVLMYLVLRFSVFGLHVAAAGNNPRAAIAAGIPVTRVMAKAVLLGAALAGVAGGLMVLGLTFRVAEAWSEQWGFTGIPVALLGANPLGVLLVGFVFAVLDTGSLSMQARTGVPAALEYLFQGLPVLIYLALNSSTLLRRSGQE